MKRNWLFAVLALTLTACGAPHVREMSDPATTLVFGYISQSDKPMDYGWVQLKHTDSRGNVTYYTTSAYDGMFYAENLPLGKYSIHRFGQGTMRPMGNSPTLAGGSGSMWILGDEGGAGTATVVKKPGVHYMGSFKYTYVEPKTFFGRGSFAFDRADAPPEKELLQHLLAYTKNTKWEGRVQARADQLQ